VEIEHMRIQELQISAAAPWSAQLLDWIPATVNRTISFI
jgi:hypothetical protein